jgi:hypothetical protein
MAMFASWNIIRVLRLVLGGFVVYQGFVSSQWLLSGLGVLFVTQALLNAGCCAGSCEPSRPRNQESTSDALEYEEVK